MAEKIKMMSVLVDLPKPMMDAISARAAELGVCAGHVASALLQSGVGVEALSRVKHAEPRLVIEPK